MSYETTECTHSFVLENRGYAIYPGSRLILFGRFQRNKIQTWILDKCSKTRVFQNNREKEKVIVYQNI